MHQLEAKIAEFQAALFDEAGNPRPIERFDFEPLGGQVRWTIWGRATAQEPRRRLLVLTARMADTDGLLSATKLFLAIATNNLGDKAHGQAQAN